MWEDAAGGGGNLAVLARPGVWVSELMGKKAGHGHR